jgi:MFS family permease
MIDKIGKRANMTLIASILGVISFFSFYFVNILISLVILGFCYSIFASVLWPCVALVVEKNNIGLALGIMQSFQNFTLFVSPIIVAFIYSSTDSYNLVIDYFIVLCLIAVILSLLLFYEDYRKNCISLFKI